MKLRNKKTGEIVEVNALGLVFNRHNQLFPFADRNKLYTIAELCGEEEE